MKRFNMINESFVCEKCHNEHKNIICDDDNMDLIIKLSVIK